MDKKAEKSKVVSIKNRDIGFKYDIIDRIECGIELKGTEVKSIRDSKCNLKDSFALIVHGEIILKNVHISPYEMGNINNVNPTRDRKLLVHKLQVLKLNNYLKQGGYTLIASKMYTARRWVKIELCLCKGKKLYDKREVIKEKDSKRMVNEFKKMS